MAKSKMTNERILIEVSGALFKKKSVKVVFLFSLSAAELLNFVSNFASEF